jgi:aromatic ring-opening dioxygenase catalytic subunit (LigB family)
LTRLLCCWPTVFQLSLKKNLDIAEHLKLGEALQPLREEGVLIIGSGQTTHNMNQMGVSSTPSWCRQFTDWFHDVVTNPTYSTEDRKQRLLECRKQPSLVLAHPRIEHFLPSIVICAAAGYSAGSVLYNETVLGSMVMSTVKFAGV